MIFRSPPGWPTPPEGWSPPTDWQPQPDWPAAPKGWAFWADDAGHAVEGPWVPRRHGEPASAAPVWPLWMFVGAAFVLSLLDSILSIGNPAIVGAAAAFVNLICFAADVTALRRAGHHVPWYLYLSGLLVVPLYLILRIHLTRKSWWLLAAWAGALIVGGAIAVLVALFDEGLETAGPDAEMVIEDTYASEGTHVQAHCPTEIALQAGNTVTCDLVGLDGVRAVEVTVESWLGDVSWLEIRG